MALTEAQALHRLALRRAAGVSDLGAEVRQRIEELGAMALSTPPRRDAFAEVISAYQVPPFELVLDLAESSIEPADRVLHLKGLLVERKPGNAFSPVAIIERLIDFSTGTAEHVFFSVMDAYRNRGIAPRIMLQSFALYDRLGLARITVHAGLESGRFYWAGRVGYDFADEAQRRHVERWATFVLGALRVEHDLDGIVEPQQWALLGTEVDPTVSTTFRELASALPAKLPMALLDPNSTGVVGYVPAAQVQAGQGMVDGSKHLRLVREGNALADDDQIVLGKAIMLTGPDWFGVFDLADTVRRGEYEREARARL
jgi:hypothetical protein